MRRQDWKQVARVLRSCKPSPRLLSEFAHWRLTVGRLATAFEENPEFDRARFQRDCGLDLALEMSR